MTILNIVVPCFNEEAVLPETARRLCELIDRLVASERIDPVSGVYFVDDGSKDRTWELVGEMRAKRPDRFHGIKLSRNRGHQNALLAGLRLAPGDVLVSLDADLQDDLEAVPTMLARFAEGYDIVYGVRAARDSDTVFKRHTAWLYYALLGYLGVQVVPDHADFRLMSRRSLVALERYGEVNIFLRAIVPLLGFRSTTVLYQRHPRFAGASQYDLMRMLGLAANGITSFSMRPLRLITVVGTVMAALSFVVGLWAIAVAVLTTRAVSGWASIVVPITFVGGLQLLSIGVIGEYVGKIYLEVKHRPLFEIEDMI